jgi:hypothetical protein
MLYWQAVLALRMAGVWLMRLPTSSRGGVPCGCCVAAGAS